MSSNLQNEIRSLSAAEKVELIDAYGKASKQMCRR
jgi:hypothetical protein